MLFSEFLFWEFFAAVLVLYLVLPHRAQNRMLLVASYVFYGAWDWRFLSLIIFSTAVDYLVALQMSRSTQAARRKALLVVSLVVNLGLLGVFKYLGFFVDSFVEMADGLGWTVSAPVLHIVLPVGISFYTFQTLSYTIDVYRREMTATTDLLNFALYVAFFPQLVAGPIERARHLLPEIEAPRQVSLHKLGRGAVLCLVGLIKKIAIADAIAPSVDAVYANPAATGAEILIATWLFAVQIYCDFSGYTDIARGVARMLGFDLMRNFMQPYFATDIQQFWRRWHISLSTWLRDYLYISLGGNRRGRRRTQINLILTMVLGGLWHGAAWNFVLWGAFHGALLALHRAIAGRRHDADGGQRPTLVRRFGAVIKGLLFFQVICYGWLLFRARSFDQIVEYTRSLAGIRLSEFAALAMPGVPVPALAAIAFVACWDGTMDLRRDGRFYETWPLPVQGMLFACMIYILAFGATTAPSAFIYFQF